MIVWRFWITLKDTLSKEEVKEFEKRFPNIFFEPNGLYRVDIDADTRETAVFIFKNTHGIFPLWGDKAVQKIEIEPRFEKRQLYYVENLDELL